MDYSDRDPRDVPEPKTVDDAADEFGLAVMTLVPQVSIAELGVSTVAHSRDGAARVTDSVAISFTVWRNPKDRTDPGNLADIADEVLASLDVPTARPLPAWMRDRLELMKYPTIWEGVMTTRRTGPSVTVEQTLVDHANHVLRNTFAELRVSDALPGELDLPVGAQNVEPTRLIIDGSEMSGVTIGSDPHIVAVGADLGDRILTAVLARDHLPFLTLEFSTRVRPGTAPTLRIVD
jgi:hypothetical protein